MDVENAASRILKSYPRVYLACHHRHERSRNNEQGLSRRDAQILQHLDRDPPYGAGELAVHLGIGPPTLSAAIDKLENLRLARRETAKSDRRRIHITLTKEGKKAMNSASVLDPELLEQLLQALAPDQRNLAVKGLELLSAAAEGLLEERSGAS